MHLQFKEPASRSSMFDGSWIWFPFPPKANTWFNLGFKSKKVIDFYHGSYGLCKCRIPLKKEIQILHGIFSKFEKNVITQRILLVDKNFWRRYAIWIWFLLTVHIKKHTCSSEIEHCFWIPKVWGSIPVQDNKSLFLNFEGSWFKS